MVLIITNNNPYIFSAGVQKYIQVQDRAFQDHGIDSLTVFPIVKETKIGRIQLSGAVVRIKDERSYRTLNDKHVALLIKEYGRQINAVLIHHVKNWDLALLHQILLLTNGPVVFYIHDYYSCCTSINLLRNGRVFCGSSILNENKCRDCRFYEKTLKIKSEIEKILISVEKRLDVIAPSEVAATYWSEAFFQFKEKVRVVSHQFFSEEYKDNKEIISKCESIRVAFVGAGDYLKGVDYWKDAVCQLGLNNKIAFFHFGRANYSNENVKHFDVNVNTNNQDAMTSALRKNKIHVAVLNSFVPETYSFTYYEALASNCYIITNENSGNIAYEVKKRHNGVVLSNPADLTQYLTDAERLKKEVNEFRKDMQNGPLKIYPNSESIFPCLIERDLENKNKSFSVKRSLLEFFIDCVYKKKYPVSKMNS